MVPKFDKQSIINILQALDGAERAKYLKAHRNEIAKNLVFMDEKELGEFIFNLVTSSAIPVPADIRTIEDKRLKITDQCNALIAAEITKLLHHQLAAADDFAFCYQLLTRLTKPIAIAGIKRGYNGYWVDWHDKALPGGTHDILYPFRPVFAEAMHPAIHNPQEMGQVARLLNVKDAAIFIKAQHKYWEKHKKQNQPVKNAANPAVLFAPPAEPAPRPSAPPAEYFEPPMAGK